MFRLSKVIHSPKQVTPAETLRTLDAAGPNVPIDVDFALYQIVYEGGKIVSLIESRRPTQNFDAAVKLFEYAFPEREWTIGKNGNFVTTYNGGTSTAWDTRSHAITVVKAILQLKIWSAP